MSPTLNLQHSFPYAPVSKEVIKPTRVVHIYEKWTPSADESLVREFGGKAVSFARLMRLGLNVPRAWVIPCLASITQPLLDLSDIKYYAETSWSTPTFAVRSGAPVSMPGLLSTKLNVPYNKVFQAIQEVWDSWNTDHAKEYRAAKGISNEIGTAVIIQQMIPASQSGVAFTNSPTNGYDPSLFQPVIEYVDGTGDGLVGGEKEGIVVDQESSLYGLLEPALELIHNTYGASDTEWCRSSGGTVYFVQQRALKFTSTQKVQDDDGRVFLTKGRAIGATCKVTAKVIDAAKITNVATIKSTDAIYVAAFRPEYYPMMAKCSAIITKVGGETCHAAIIARELNRPAISGVSAAQMESILSKEKVLIDGSSGKIFEALESDEHTEAQEYKAVSDLSRTPDIAVATKGNYNVNLIMYRFYMTLDNHAKGICSDERKNQVVKEIATVFATYLYMATLCETRWTRSNCKLSKMRRNVLMVLTRNGIEVPTKNSPLIKNRGNYASVIPQPSSLEQATLIMKWVTKGFLECGWGSSYGGKKWAAISDLLYRYLCGEISDTIFVDSAFNLKHNGNYAFDKFDWLFCDAGYLQYQLNARANGIDKLRQQTMNYYPFSTLEQAVENVSIFDGKYTHALCKG